MPVAIQLFANQTENNPIWTPNDAKYDWLLAKICFNNANGQVQQLKDHLLDTHLSTEPFAIALRRCLPRTHPIYKLLFPHLQKALAINANAREQLLESGQMIHSLFSIGKARVRKKCAKLVACSVTLFGQTSTITCTRWSWYRYHPSKNV